MNAHNDLYVLLDVARAASLHEIKRAFRRLARRYHPDINPGNQAAEERFKQITEAYEILSSPPKRRFYDENGFYVDPQTEAIPQPTASFRFHSFDFSGASRMDSVETFGDFFRTPEHHGPERGEDLEYPVSVSFGDSMRGLRTRIAVHRQMVCASCAGAGHAGTQTPCLDCRGEGRVSRIKGRLQFSVNCATCGGSGRIWLACPECDGEGRTQGV
jgi:molecular chaperone DnaJ